MNSVNADKNIGATVVDLKTGQELDAEIAERVMGWFRNKGMSHGKPQDVFTDRNGSTRTIYCECAEDFRPSIDIADAMEVAEKMRERGSQVVMRSWEGAVPWSVKFISYTSRDEAEEDGDDLPEAICRAALKATECLSTNNESTDGQAVMTLHNFQAHQREREGKNDQ